MSRSWTSFLHGGAPSGHGVQFYARLDELARSVVTYLAAGFEVGQPAIVLARPKHASAFRERLLARGWDPSGLEARGLLVFADAELVLDRIMLGDEPSPDAFDRMIGGLLTDVAARYPARRPRAFGELVDLLCERGRFAAAVTLEELWNDLARRRSFSLLCGYRLDVFDRATQTGRLPDLCRLHSHVKPAHDEERFAEAVSGALEEVVGRVAADDVYVAVSEQARNDRVPAPQLVLMWVSAHMPAVADRVLAAARARYASAGAHAAAG